MASIISYKHAEDPELQRKVKQVSVPISQPWSFLIKFYETPLHDITSRLNVSLTLIFVYEGDGCHRTTRRGCYCSAAWLWQWYEQSHLHARWRRRWSGIYQSQSLTSSSEVFQILSIYELMSDPEDFEYAMTNMHCKLPCSLGRVARDIQQEKEKACCQQIRQCDWNKTWQKREE